MGIDIAFWIILLVMMIVTAFFVVVIRTLPMATVLLALTSVLLAIFLFISGMKLAAVMELSVSAGLVTAILASAIALLKPTENDSDTNDPRRNWLKRYLPLPIIMLLLAALVLILVPGTDVTMAREAMSDTTAQMVLWDERTLDILGLTLLMLAGVLGVVALIRRREEK